METGARRLEAAGRPAATGERRGKAAEPPTEARGRALSWRLCLAPAGGAIAAACFFLPWGRITFLAAHCEACGSHIGGSAWASFGMAAIVTVGGLLLARPGRPTWTRPVVLGAAFLGLILVVVKAVGLSHGIWTPFGHVRPQDVGVKLGVGAVGMVAGFLLAVAGSLVVADPWPRWTSRRGSPSGVEPRGHAGPGSGGAA
jgi:hypothetical protein